MSVPICADHLCEYKPEINGVVLGIYHWQEEPYPPYLAYIVRADQWRCPEGLERIYNGFGQRDYDPSDYDRDNHVRIVL